MGGFINDMGSNLDSQLVKRWWICPTRQVLNESGWDAVLLMKWDYAALQCDPMLPSGSLFEWTELQRHVRAVRWLTLYRLQLLQTISPELCLLAIAPWRETAVVRHDAVCVVQNAPRFEETSCWIPYHPRLRFEVRDDTKGTPDDGVRSVQISHTGRHRNGVNPPPHK